MRKKLVLTVFGVLLVTALSIAVYAFRPKSDDKGNLNPPSPSLDVQKTSILANSKITTPQIENKVEINAEELPENLKVLIHPSAIDTKISRVNYASGTGYEIVYRVPNALKTVYGKMYSALAGNWEFVSGSRNNNYALTERQNSQFKVKIIFEQVVDGTSVDVQVLSTKQ